MIGQQYRYTVWVMVQVMRLDVMGHHWWPDIVESNLSDKFCHSSLKEITIDFTLTVLYVEIGPLQEWNNSGNAMFTMRINPVNKCLSNTLSLIFVSVFLGLVAIHRLESLHEITNGIHGKCKQLWKCFMSDVNNAHWLQVLNGRHCGLKSRFVTSTEHSTGVPQWGSNPLWF